VRNIGSGTRGVPKNTPLSIQAPSGQNILLCPDGLDKIIFDLMVGFTYRYKQYFAPLAQNCVT
jgi:hypothetical protein